MKLHTVVAIATLLGVVTGAFAQAPQASQDGAWWSRLDMSAKLSYVQGFAKGNEHAAMEHIVACASLWNLVKSINTAFTNEQWQKICFPSSDFDGIRMGQFVDGLDAFYRDYRNQRIDASWAIVYVRDGIKGKPQTELDGELSQMRKLVAAVPAH